MLRIDAVCKRSSGVTCHPVDLVRATAADNDIALSASECPRSQTHCMALALGNNAYYCGFIENLTDNCISVATTET